MLNASVHERYGPTAEAIKKGEVLEEYVRDVLKRFDYHLTTHHVQIVTCDLTLYPHEHRHFEAELQKELMSRIKWDNILARERDADSVAYVMRKRKGKGSIDITKSLPFLLTKNAPLCSIATRFCRERGLIGEYDVGPAIHQRQLASVIWMLVGDEGRKELARRDLIRRCADVVRCRPDVVAKTREELRRVDLDKARQFEALVTRPRPTQLLMDLTLGARRVVTSENLDTIFQRLRESSAEDVRQKADEEIKQLKKHQREQRRKWEDTLDQEKSARDRSAQDLHEERNKRERAQADLAAMREREMKIIEGWLDTSRENEIHTNMVIDMLLYGALALIAIVSFTMAIWGTYPYLTGVVSAVATVVACGIAIGEKTGKLPRLGRRRVFQKRLEFIQSRAQEARREDLLAHLDVEHHAMTIRTKERNAAHAETPVTVDNGRLALSPRA